MLNMETDLKGSKLLPLVSTAFKPGDAKVKLSKLKKKTQSLKISKVIKAKKEYTDADLGWNDFAKNMEGYDTILLGYPNWWASIPMPIASFLEE